MTDQKHQRKRSFSRMLGQSVVIDAAGRKTAAGAPIEVRIAYPYVHELRTKTAAGDKIDFPGYEASILVPKLAADATQCPNYAALAAHCMEAATEAWGSWPAGGKWPIQDGDIPHAQKLTPGQVPLTPEQIAERNKWRTGSWIIEVSSGADYPPQVAVVQNGVEVPVTAKTVGGQQMYKSGDYGYVFLHSFTFHNKTFGVDFGFNGICFTRPGEKIGSSGAKSIQSMFGGVGAAVGAGMAAAQPPGTAPAAPPAGTAPMPPAAAPVAPPAAPVAPVAPPAPPAAPIAAAAPPAPPLPMPPAATAPTIPAFPTPGA